MKKGYKRLLMFELIIFIVLILNSFVWNILNRYTIILFLIALLSLFKYLFGFEKDNHRFTKDIILETIIFFIIFFMIYYLLGVVIGFARTANYFTFNGLKTFFIPIVFFTFLEEYLRYVMMCKAQDEKMAVILTIILFVFLDSTSIIYYTNFDSTYAKFIFLSLTLLPAICRNVGFSILTLKVGYKPLILYQLVIGLYYYIFPIVPNSNEYLTSIIQFCIPILYTYRCYKFLSGDHNKDVERDYHKKRFIPFTLSILVVLGVVYLTSGYFHYWSVAIASGSMEPKIRKGDVVIIEKIGNDYSKLTKGDVIAFKYKNVVVVHRIINVVKDQANYYFYTKGDANNKEDNFVVEEHMILGEVNCKIPFVGLPTVWLNKM